jgi:uncharacterized protein
MTPPQRLSFVTLGVADLGKSRKFYAEKFGWQSIDSESDGIVFFQLNGLILALFPADELADDAGVLQNGAGFKRFSLAINCHTQKEIDEIFSRFELLAVDIIKAPAKTFWGGYSGYVRDIDLNLWEFAFNPFIQLDKNGNIAAPA